MLDHGIVPGRLRVQDGRIAAIEPDHAEADGPFVVPGFVDVHVHGWGGHDAMGSTTDLDGMARALLRHGVTSFLPDRGRIAVGQWADPVELDDDLVVRRVARDGEWVSAG